MNWPVMLSTAGALIAAVGGAGALILLFSGYLGRIWATRIAQQEKAVLEAELEKIKSMLQRDTSAHVDALTRKRNSYIELAKTLRIFLQDDPKLTERQRAFLSAYDNAFMWASDGVAQAVGDFLDSVIQGEKRPPTSKQETYRRCVEAMRRDTAPDTSATYRVVSF